MIDETKGSLPAYSSPSPSSQTSEEYQETPNIPYRAIPSRLGFAFAGDSQSDLRLVSYLCAEDDLPDKSAERQSFALPHDFDDDSSDADWYLLTEDEGISFVPPTPTMPGGISSLQDTEQERMHLNTPLPPQTSTSSTFAFFQNHFLKGSGAPIDSDTSSLSTASCYSFSTADSQEGGAAGPSRYWRQPRAGGTVISSTLGGLDVYMRTGSIINWTHHPQYAAQIGTDRLSQKSFLGELSTWDTDRFDFDPITPFARDWQSKGEGGKEHGELYASVPSVGSSLRTTALVESEWETVQAPTSESFIAHMSANVGAAAKRLKKRRPSKSSSEDIPREGSPASPSSRFRIFAPLRTCGAVLRCPTRGGATPGSPLQLLLPRPDLDALFQPNPQSPCIASMKGRQGIRNEAWVLVDVMRKAPSEKG
ncbi:hypothetical protein DFP72DRAFT_283448 [Ephemerocybe angulata]|uniref:Uncharacterized protein n=1 Tax=Ephemerocybe angulata TaxID=980116 RepID=A0A8H6I2R7_9AGAR|nr:hypothetical protein DFP72DRAFT_283448 [Tulosesus angulatus]